MTVFVLTQSDVTDVEGYTMDSAKVLGVYSTREKAEKALDFAAVAYNYGRTPMDYYIDEMEVL